MKCNWNLCLKLVYYANFFITVSNDNLSRTCFRAFTKLYFSSPISTPVLSWWCYLLFLRPLLHICNFMFSFILDIFHKGISCFEFICVTSNYEYHLKVKALNEEVNVNIYHMHCTKRHWLRSLNVIPSSRRSLISQKWI